MAKIAVMGAGAVGCYYGGMLALAGEAVTLIGRPGLVAQVRREGLIFEKGGETRLLPMAATEGPEGVAGAEIVLFCVKSADTEAAGQAMLPHLAPGAVVLSLQNGISNAERLSAVLGRPVIPAVVYVASQMGGAGHVVHHGRGELVLGEEPGADGAAAVLNAAGIGTEVSAGAAVAMWTKLVINCAFNALSASTLQPYGRIGAEPGALETMRAIVAECRAVAGAEGIALPDTLEAQVEAITRSMAGQISSTAQDVTLRKPTEIAFLNGEIVARGDRAGVPVPLNRALSVIVRLIEARYREPQTS
ncbi:ketopantoate reductase family protein [Frigidibacter sp. MR17.14]|uniref:ketopantoate reductase family protein n=1 Tax=Frigidibacter sp. MR17.14 TaxID=3126509 RepID=UPI003012CF49